MDKNMKKIVSILVGLVCLFGAQLAKAQGIALRTNLVEWGLQAPNIGVDLVLSETSTLSIGVAATAGEMYIRDAFVQCGQVEYRYWFSAQPYENFFLGLQFTPTHYRLKLDKRDEFGKNRKHVHNGVAFPVGFNFGYSWPLNSKLNLEACYGAGWMFYNNNCSYHPKNTSHRMTFTTTNVGLNITYILK